MREGLSFDDVLIVPNQHCEIGSRKDPDVSVVLDEERDLVLSEPVIASPMDTVASPELLGAMSAAGTFGIMHRYGSYRDQVETVAAARELALAERAMVFENDLFAVSIGSKDAFCDDLDELLDCVSIVCVDVANGDSVDSVNMVRNLRRYQPNLHIIAGNVATPQGFHRLCEAGADSIRVGIGPGSACSTRTMTGIGVPQLTAIMWCREIADNYNVKLIADGGIRTPADLSKAMAAGADIAMLGSAFAGSAESPGDVFEDENGRLVKKFRGMASEAAQRSRGTKGKIVPEGVEGTVPYRGTVRDVIDFYVGGLRSSMTYVNARNLDEYWMNTEFMKVSKAAVVESNPHLGKL